MSTPLYVARHRLAEQIGGFGQFVATGGSTSTVICAAAFKSPDLPTSALAYAWIYNPTSVYPKQQRVRKDGLTFGSGQINLADVIGTAFINSTVFEVHTRMPAARETADGFGQATQMGCLECLNAGLRHIRTETTRALSLVSGQQDYAISDAWLGHRGRLKDVREQDAFNGGTRSTSRPWELRGGTGTRTFHVDAPYRFTSGAPTIDLVVERPADTAIKVSGSWTDSTVGVLNETDEADVEVSDWVTVALVYAYSSLSAARSGPARQRYADLAQKQLAIARGLACYDTSQEIELPPAATGRPALAAAS